MQEISGEPRCRVCGCSEERACPGGCSWVHDDDQLCDLCSACVGATCEKRLIPLTEKKMRICGKPATRKLDGRFFCDGHRPKARAA